MLAASQAGVTHKFTDALVWVSFLMFFKERGLKMDRMGLVIGAYGMTCGIL